MHTESDHYLLNRWLHERDALAFREIARRHSQMVLATCRRILRNATEAEDLTQECFLALAQQRDRLPESLPAWLHVVAVRRCLNHLRAHGRQHARDRAFAEAQTVGLQPQLENLLAEVDEAMADLPELCRAPLVLHFLEQRSQAEIAAQLDISQSTVSRRIDQGIAQLRERLQSRGVAVSALALVAAFQAEAATVVPATLAAALGKISLAGNAAEATAASSVPLTTLATIGGLLIVKKLLIAAASIAVVAAGAWWTLSPQETSPTALAESREQAPQPAAGAPLPVEPTVPEEPASSTAPSEEGSISGRVIDAASGKGLPGVTITAKRDNIESSAVSDSEGIYRVSGLIPLPHCTYELARDTPPGYRAPTYMERKSVQLDAAGEASGVDFLLRPEVPLRGKVVDERNQPVAEASVLLGGGVDFYVGQTISTEVDGSFAFHNLPPTGDLHLVASKEELAASEIYSFELPEAGMTDVVLTLLPACRVAGTVVDRTGTPLEGFEVMSLPVPHARGSVGKTQPTDALGHFEISGLATGAYELVAVNAKQRHSGSEQKGLPVELAPGDVLEGLTVVYNRDFGIAGRVVNSDGEPIAGAEVRAGSSQYGGGQAESDAEGRFRISELEEGDYQINAGASDHQYVQLGGVPAGTNDLEIVLADPFVVTGRVLDGRSGNPLTEFEIVLSINWPDHLEGWAEKEFKKVSHPEGRFELHQIQTYRSVLAARAPGYATAMTFLDLTGPPYAHEVDMKLQPGQDLNGKVVNAQGAPIAGVSIFLGKVLARGDRATTQSAADGSFQLSSFPAQPQLVSAYLSGYAPASKMITGGASLAPVEFVLTGGASVHGRVSFAEGVIPESCQVRVIYAEAHFAPEMTTDVLADGTYRLEHVQPGEVEVCLASGVGKKWSEVLCITKGVDVPQGSESVVDFHVPAAGSALEGMIKYPGGALPSHVSLALKIDTEEGTLSRTALAAPNGTFSFADVPPGQGELAIDASFLNHRRIVTTVDVEVEETSAYTEIAL